MNIYSQYLLLWTFVCVSNVLCQSFNLWTKYLKPSFTWCNNIPKCNVSFTFVKRMFQISIATTFMIEVVTTLTLGSRPRQRGCKGAGQEKAWESHHILPRQFPLWEMESRWTPESSESDSGIKIQCLVAFFISLESS
jgi:hypothetical protein